MPSLCPARLEHSCWKEIGFQSLRHRFRQPPSIGAQLDAGKRPDVRRSGTSSTGPSNSNTGTPSTLGWTVEPRSYHLSKCCSNGTCCCFDCQLLSILVSHWPVHRL